MAHVFDSQKEVFFTYNTLACLAKSLLGEYTCVDLRNESSVSGKLEHVDGFMNISMSDVLLRDHRDRELTFPNFFIQSRNVMYIHIPNHVNIMNNIQSALQFKPKERSVGGRTLKQKRAQDMQREVMQLIKKQKQEKKNQQGSSTSTQK